MAAHRAIIFVQFKREQGGQGSKRIPQACQHQTMCVCQGDRISHPLAIAEISTNRLNA